MDYIGEIVALGIDSLFFGAALKHYLSCSRAVKAVKDIKVYDVSELEDVFEAEGGHKIPYTGVRGLVKAIGAPLHSLNDTSVTCVVQKLTVREHMLARGPSGFWTNHNRLIQEVHNYVPFVICAGNQNVEVLDPLNADILDLHTIADKYDPTSTTIADHLWSFLMGVRQRGLQSTEEILKEGSVLTCFGEVTIKKVNNHIKIQRPSNGSPYFITTSPASSIVHRLQRDISRYKVILSVTATLGIVIFSVAAYRWWKKRSDELKRERRNQMREAAREARRLQNGDDELPETQQCVVCCDCPREIVVFPCGHFCMCEDCSERITTTCPICRTVIESRSHAYF